ncbi:MAG: hypothetical protein U1E53_02250 [Dongiaceae bacterium]
MGSQSAQARSQEFLGDKSHRRELYTAFIEEAAKLYGEALVSTSPDVPRVIGLYAIASRMRVLSSETVFERADKVIQTIVDTYLEPNRTLEELRLEMHSHNLDLLRSFSEACREDLTRRRAI